MQVCTTLSLHQPSAHPGLSLPCYPAIPPIFTVNGTIVVYGIALIPLHAVLGMHAEQDGGTAKEDKARILCRGEGEGAPLPDRCREVALERSGNIPCLREVGMFCC